MEMQGFGGPRPSQNLKKNDFILCISIKNVKYFATKIEVGLPNV